MIEQTIQTTTSPPELTKPSPPAGLAPTNPSAQAANDRPQHSTVFCVDSLDQAVRFRVAGDEQEYHPQLPPAPQLESVAALAEVEVRVKLLEPGAEANAVGESPQASQPRVHQFSRSFARRHGVKAAIIAGYLANRIGYTRKREGEGYRCTLDALAKHYPYLCRSAIATALKGLVEDKVLTIHRNNWRCWDQTTHYAFAAVELRHSAQLDPIYFRVEEATLHALPAALLLTNFRLRLADERKRGRLGSHYRVCAQTLSEKLPLTSSTISRALNQMARQGIIALRRCHGFDRAYELDVTAFLALDAKLDLPPAKTDSHKADPEAHDAIKNAHAPNPDITKSLKADIQSGLCKPLLNGRKNSYERRPAAPSAEGVCFIFPAGPAVIGGRAPAPVASGESASAQPTNPGNDIPERGGDSSLGAAHPITPPLPVDKDSRLWRPPPSLITPTRQPLPSTLAELRSNNRSELASPRCERSYVETRTKLKIAAVVGHQGMATVFRWLAIKDDEQLFQRIREAVERCPYDHMDRMGIGDKHGVDRFCVEWLLDACRHYLDDSMEVARGWETPRVSQYLAPRLAEYYELNKAELEREGLGHLRSGEYVIEDRATSPDVELEDREDLSPGEKARVLYNALLSINRGGAWSRLRGSKMYGVVSITASGLRQAREFFTLNPSASVTPLLQLMAECIELAHGGAQPSGFQEDFCVRRGVHLGYFMRHLEAIAHKIDREDILSFTETHFLKSYETSEAA